MVDVKEWSDVMDRLPQGDMVVVSFDGLVYFLPSRSPVHTLPILDYEKDGKGMMDDKGMMIKE